MKLECKHKWVQVNRTTNKRCTECGEVVMQGRIGLPMTSDLSVPNIMPLGRETIEVPYLTPNGEHTRIEIYKDDLIKQMNKEIGLSVNLFENAAR